MEQLEGRRLLSVGVSQTSLFYHQTNLVSDGAIAANVTDPNLVNAWGLAEAPTGVFWIADNGTGLSTVYTRTGQIVPLVVTIPTAAGNTTGANPTGMVLNDLRGFRVTNGTTSGRARFLFVSEDGTISGWNPAVDATNAIPAINNPDGVYKGVALARFRGQPHLYAANFESGHIDVFDRNFVSDSTLPGTFTDPNLPAGFAPFNIAAIGNHLFVTFALQDAAKHDDVAGAGNGFVDEFTTGGELVRRFASQGTLNSPWGMALAPAGFGTFGGALLVGNFGDGHINAFNPATGQFLGQLESAANTPVVIDGLWSLRFGQVGGRVHHNTLFFTAGPNGEANGLFGRLRPAAPTATTAGKTTFTQSLPFVAASAQGGVFGSGTQLAPAGTTDVGGMLQDGSANLLT